MILVSACLLGVKCKYSGGDNFSPAVLAYLQDQEYIACCPEMLGGLPTPRPPAEIQAPADGDSGPAKVLNREGQDVSAAFLQGAEAALALALENAADTAILKEGSPSCGVHCIYDGSFSGKKIPGSGLSAALLKENGIRLISSDEL
ncbi:MAG: DUF523 domain-containing protein [Bacillota bacterium]|nr:DUF523 domain-containing protein [Bacillota bacterium]